MHFFVSDLHITDTDIGGVVSDAELTAFVDQLGRIAEEKSKRLTLVFVGDVLELLRSHKWDALWIKGSAPWSGMTTGFGNFLNGGAEDCAVEIAKQIRDRYKSFSARLKQLARSGKIETKYVYGNHDYMVQLSPKLREMLIDILALSGSPEDPFPLTYSNEAASVFATHGHASDAVNWHDEAGGFWAMGDAIVLRIVNRFAAQACAELGVGPNTQIGRLLQDIDNIEPLADIPLYVRWLAETSLSTLNQRQVVEKVWCQVVNEFLDIDVFMDHAGYGSETHQTHRAALWFSTQMGFAELLRKLADLSKGKEVDYVAQALIELQKQQYRYRFILFGHTHQPMLVPLAVTGGRPSFYVNTGCWRRLVTRTPGAAPFFFVPRRVASYFQIDDAGDSAVQERYHLHQGWHAI